MPKIDLKLRSYEELKLETYKLITDRYLLQLANDKLQQIIDKAIEILHNDNYCHIEKLQKINEILGDKERK